MLYWRRVPAVVRGCQAPKRISASPGGARKRAQLGYTERSCTSGLYSGSELRPILRRVKHVRVKSSQRPVPWHQLGYRATTFLATLPATSPVIGVTLRFMTGWRVNLHLSRTSG